MIDIHTHLLNNVDDGSRGVIESLTSFKLAEKAGFTDIILTPHYIDGYYDNDYESTKPKIQELKSKLYDNNILINLHQGNEIYISEKIGEWIENGVVSKLGKSRYLLFELPQKSRLFSFGSSKFSINLSHNFLIFNMFSLGDSFELYFSASGLSE